MDKRKTISLLWITVMINMAFADILTFILPGTLQEIQTGHAGNLEITQGILLVFAFLIEIPICMIFLSRVLKGKINGILNVTAAIITSGFVIGGGSFTLHYLFFAGMEVAAMIGISVLSSIGLKRQEF